MALSLSGCGEGAAVRIAQKVGSGVSGAARASADDAVASAAPATRAAVVESRGIAAASEAAVAIEYRRLVQEELRSATFSTLCRWMGSYIAYGSLPSADDFETALVDALVTTAGRLGVQPQAVWITQYVNAADALAVQVVTAPDVGATVQAAMIELACG
jgi:hypothetical protein